MTSAAPVESTALSASVFPFASSVGPRLVRAALALAAVSALGGCALWTAMFSENPPEVPVPTPPTVASAPQAAVSAPVAPAPAVAVVEPTPAPVVSTPVNAPPPPTAAELTPPSPLPMAAAPTAHATSSAPGTSRTSKAVPTAAGFYINVGLFAVPTNGANAVHKLEAAHQPVFSEVIESKKGALTRVRVGPFAKRAEADAAAQKIHALKLDAVVFQRP